MCYLKKVVRVEENYAFESIEFGYFFTMDDTQIDNQITTSKVHFERNSFVHSIHHSLLCILISFERFELNYRVFSNFYYWTMDQYG